MSVAAHGKHTSAVGVINVSAQGLWFLAHDKEIDLSCEDFPWFQEQAVKSLVNVEEHSPGHSIGPTLTLTYRKKSLSVQSDFHSKPGYFPKSASRRSDCRGALSRERSSWHVTIS